MIGKVCTISKLSLDRLMYIINEGCTVGV